MKKLTKQDIHNLVMEIAGNSLKNEGYEFLTVNSKLEKDPQFVSTKNKQLHFIIVRAIEYPENPVKYDCHFMSNIFFHAIKFKARTHYAGVGLAKANEFNKEIVYDSSYAINFNGLQEIILNEKI
tara:strand:+ start:1440 stop:1814 length:375 start_codon:yes stop_codon:yes gene_type:complete